MKKLKIGIIGCGGIANSKHMPALQKLGDRCEMTAFCDIVPERAEEAAKTYGVPNAKTYTDYKELLKDKEIDVVHVLTPNVSHCPITVDAFAAGKHVMCEKPMAATTEDAQAMLDAWKKSGKKFTVGYQNRFRQDAMCLHAACEAGELGDIYVGKAHAIRRRAVPTWGVFPNKALQGGGPLIDIGTHALDLTLWCMDNYEVESVTGSVFYKMGNLPSAVEGNKFGPWDPKTYEVEDSAFGFIKMKNGATIFLEASWALNVKQSREACCTLCGTLAGAEMLGAMSTGEHDLLFNKTCHGVLTEEHFSQGDEVAFFEGESKEPQDLEAQQWLSCIENDTDPVVLPEQAFMVTKILDAIYQSAKTGKEIKF